jgi:hypothetical protein
MSLILASVGSEKSTSAFHGRKFGATCFVLFVLFVDILLESPNFHLYFTLIITFLIMQFVRKYISLRYNYDFIVYSL